MKFSSKKFSSNKQKTILKVNIDDCAKACNDEFSFECLSFDFCYLHGDCRLSKSRLGNDEQEFVDSSECDIYESENKA